jgi:hypothetical protein
MKLKKAISHREHRDHRGKTNGCKAEAIHLFGEATRSGETTALSVTSVA